MVGQELCTYDWIFFIHSLAPRTAGEEGIITYLCLGTGDFPDP